MELTCAVPVVYHCGSLTQTATVPPNPSSFKTHLTTADPSGAAPQAGTNDTSTAILQPKKLLVDFASLSPIVSDEFCRPNRLIVNEATSDNYSGESSVALKC